MTVTYTIRLRPILTLALLLCAACQPTATPAPPPTQVNPVSATATRVITPATETPAALAASVSETVSGITLSIANPRSDGGYFYIDICYDRPDDGNWLLNGVSLALDSQVMEGFRSSPIGLRDWPVNGQQLVRRWAIHNYLESWEPAAPGAKGRRCDTLDYEVGSEPLATTFTLTIQRLKNFAGTGAPGHGAVVEGPWVFTGTL